MDDLLLSTGFLVSSADTDMEGRIRPGALVNYMLQSAILSAEELGFGFESLKEQNLFWVLHRLTMEIARPLMWNEEIRVETWPRNIDGLFYLRDFLVWDKSETVIVRSTSGWLAVNRLNKRPGKVGTIHPEKFTTLKNKRSLGELPEKLDPVSGEHVTLIHPSYFDFDINRHVTTTRYIDWMADTFPADFHQDHYPGYMSVNFLKEILPGETIRLTRQDEYPYQLFEGVKEHSGIPAFRGSFRYTMIR